jgi:hypothetical protein
MRIRRTIGTELDGTTVTVTFGRTQVDVLKSSYGDKISPEAVRQMGSQAIDALTPGIYDTDEGKFSMSASVARGEFIPLLDQFGWGNRLIPLVFSYTHGEIGSDSDYVLCRITAISNPAEAASKALEVEFTIKPVQILWTDDRKTINRLGDVSERLGLSRL